MAEDGSLQSQLSLLLRRFSGDDLLFFLELDGSDQSRSTVDRLSRRLSLSILIAALLLSAAVMTTSSEKPLLQDISEGCSSGRRCSDSGSSNRYCGRPGNPDSQG